eukprot:TRINITY_DN15721_c0_g1_i2.p1 TRINITY_DN15721_c0_g1~~TRINITY_DN15721_c0_g1_i2.p1  ORF type:complete len:299 (+),score=-51.85 TRINITY_DN15721_c0_g1_i2:113-898(+)
MARTTIRPGRLCPLLLALVACLLSAPPRTAARRRSCPASMRCMSATSGFFLDGPAGHLAIAYSGKGPSKPQSCSALCKATPNCSHWMYNMLRTDGECKMWAPHQSPCAPEDTSDPETARFDNTPIGWTVVGGPCQAQAQAQQSNDTTQYRRGKCPPLMCNSPRRGFLWDHADKGHLHAFATGRRRRPHSCFVQCMETPGCGFWMYDLHSEHGDCVLWTNDQNPCLPEPGGGPDTAHFDPLPSQSVFVVGGGCSNDDSSTQS